jgi:hypothetical protein
MQHLIAIYKIAQPKDVIFLASKGRLGNQSPRKEGATRTIFSFAAFGLTENHSTGEHK